MSTLQETKTRCTLDKVHCTRLVALRIEICSCISVVVYSAQKLSMTATVYIAMENCLLLVSTYWFLRTKRVEEKEERPFLRCCALNGINQRVRHGTLSSKSWNRVQNALQYWSKIYNCLQRIAVQAPLQHVSEYTEHCSQTGLAVYNEN